jgi:hypothetical protein
MRQLQNRLTDLCQTGVILFTVEFPLILDTLRSLSKSKCPPAANLILLEIHYNKITEAKHLRLCTGMPYCNISRPAKRQAAWTIGVILLPILNLNARHGMNE